jgi:hypothetical protein
LKISIDKICKKQNGGRIKNLVSETVLLIGKAVFKGAEVCERLELLH